MEKLKNTKILGGIGLICMFLGTILPYFNISLLGYTKSISLIGYWEGKVIIALIIANLLFIFKDFIEKYIPQMFNSGIGRMIEKANAKLVIIPTILSAAFAIYMIVNINVDSSYIKYGIGFYVLWIGIISLLAYSFIYKGNQNNM